MLLISIALKRFLGSGCAPRLAGQAQFFILVLGAALVLLSWRAVTTGAASEPLDHQAAGLSGPGSRSPVPAALASDAGNTGTLPAARPNAIMISQLPLNIPLGGRAVAVGVYPSNVLTAVVASESGGLFQTVNGGSTWYHLDALPMFRLTDVAYAPASPAGQTVVIASGWGDSQTQNGGGIWRSTDNGVTWQRTFTTTLGCVARVNTLGIAFEPSSNRVYVGTDCGLAVSANLGATWTEVAPNGTRPRVRSVAAQSGGIVDVCTDAGMQRSTDGAMSFSTPFMLPFLDPSQGCASSVHMLSVSPRESQVVYAGIDVAPQAGCARATALMEGLYAPNGSSTWNQVFRTCVHPTQYAGRKPWAATIASWDGNPTHYDVYFSDSMRMWRQTCVQGSGAAPRCTMAGWTSMSSGHEDPNGMAFRASDRCPLYLVTDGGIEKPLPLASPGWCGGSWRVSGTPANGYNAIQIYQVAGQVLSDHVDLYIGTQDNNLWASSDAGSTWGNPVRPEGFGIQVPLDATYDSGQVVVFGLPTGMQASAAHFVSPRNWINAPGASVSGVTVASPGVYLQYSGMNLPTQTLFVSNNFDNNWQLMRRFGATTLRSWPQVSLNGDQVTIYQPVRRPGTTSSGDENVGMVAVRGLNRDGSFALPTLQPADAAGLGSIGVWPMGEGTYVWQSPWAVDPQNPLHLLAADVVSTAIQQSLDGGRTWLPQTQLTDLVTGYDSGTNTREFLFNIPSNVDPIRTPGAVLQAHAIAFDPFRRNHIVVGTEAAGIFRSIDGGLNWEAVPGSRQITGISSFFFIENSYTDPEDKIVVSTYGRGLWLLRISRTRRPFLLEEKFATAWSGGIIRDPQCNCIITLDQFSDPNFCPICQFIAATGGQVLDLPLDLFGKVSDLVIDSKAHAVASSLSGQAIPVPLPTKTGSQPGTFAACPVCPDILKAGDSIKGVVLKDGVLFAVLAAPGALPGEESIQRFDIYPVEPPALPEVQPFTAPYIQLAGDFALTGMLIAAPGETITVNGSGFKNGPSCSDVSLSVLGVDVAAGVKVDPQGKFQLALLVGPPPPPPGYSQVKALQTCGQTTLQDSETMLVLTNKGEVEVPSFDIFLPLLRR